MTGGEEDGPCVGVKKSYAIADILRESSPIQRHEQRFGDASEQRHGDTSAAPSITPYQPSFLFNPAALPQGHLPLDPNYDHYPKDLSPGRSTSSPGMSPSDYAMSPLTSGPGGSLLPFLSSHPHPPPPPSTFFQSPGYISLLLANHFAQPYLNHQRIPDYNPYGGRSLSLGSKRKGGQVRFAAAQTARLEKEFLDHKYLHANDRKRLAQALKLTDRQVKTWFQNRRAKWRKIGVSKVHRSESHVSASYGAAPDTDGYSPDQGRSVSVSSVLSDDSN